MVWSHPDVVEGAAAFLKYSWMHWQSACACNWHLLHPVIDCDSTQAVTCCGLLLQQVLVLPACMHPDGATQESQLTLGCLRTALLWAGAGWIWTASVCSMQACM